MRLRFEVARRKGQTVPQENFALILVARGADGGRRAVRVTVPLARRAARDKPDSDRKEPSHED
jgi:hypothetical protein